MALHSQICLQIRIVSIFEVKTRPDAFNTSTKMVAIITKSNTQYDRFWCKQDNLFPRNSGSLL